MMRARSDILHVLSSGRDMTGEEIRSAGARVSQALLYWHLNSLEKAKLITSRPISNVGGMVRRSYSITPYGRARLVEISA